MNYKANIFLAILFCFGASSALIAMNEIKEKQEKLNQEFELQKTKNKIEQELLKKANDLKKQIEELQKQYDETNKIYEENISDETKSLEAIQKLNNLSGDLRVLKNQYDRLTGNDFQKRDFHKELDKEFEESDKAIEEKSKNSTETFDEDEDDFLKEENTTTKTPKQKIVSFFSNPNRALAFIGPFIPSALTGYFTKPGYQKWWYVPVLGASWWLTHHFAQKCYETDENDHWDIREHNYDSNKTNYFWVVSALAGACTGEGLRIGRNGIADLWQVWIKRRKN